MHFKQQVMLNVCVYWQKTVNEDEFNNKVIAGIIQTAEETIPKSTGSRRKKECAMVG